MAIILVVDDEVGIRELLSEILIDEGYDVRLAENATAARRIRGELRPDLVLLDIWMPDTDGISLLKLQNSVHLIFWKSRLPCKNCYRRCRRHSNTMRRRSTHR